ncbi:MAG: hypothetical protein WC444_03980 [Candidatus Paceibacterota bacterium]
MTLLIPTTSEVLDGTVRVSSAEVTTPSPAELNKKLDRVDSLLFVVVIILLVMVATLVIDSFHINSATYKEYSEKIETLDITQKNSNQMNEQHAKNQELIIKQQAQILKLLNK